MIESLRSDPARALQHRLNAALAFLFGEQWLRDRTLWQVNSSESSGSSWWDGHYPLLFYAALLGMLCLGFLGWRWSYGWAFESMPLSLALLWIPLPYLLSHAEVLSGPRLPLDGVLCCFAAFAVASVLPRGGLLFDGATPPGRNLR